MPNIRMVGYQQHGVPRTLSGIDELSAAIRDSRLTAQSMVTIYYDDGTSKYGPAGETREMLGLIAVFTGEAVLASDRPAAETPEVAAAPAFAPGPDLVPAEPTPSPEAGGESRSGEHPWIMQVSALLGGAEGMDEAEFREAIAELGRPFDLVIEDETIWPAISDMEKFDAPLLGLVGVGDDILILPAHRYIRRFSLAHHSLYDPETMRLKPFFELERAQRRAFACERPALGELTDEAIELKERGVIRGFSA